MVTHKKEFEAANQRASALLARTPKAIAASYDRWDGRIVIDLSSDISIAFKPRNAQGLEHAKASQLSKIEISPSGLGLRFPALDADLYLPSLLEGFLGSKRWMAAQLGKVEDRRALRQKLPPHVLTASLAVVLGKLLSLASLSSTPASSQHYPRPIHFRSLAYSPLACW